MSVRKTTITHVIVEFNEDEDEHKYVEVSEWFDGEGIDVVIDDDIRFGITHSEWNALKRAILELESY